MGCNVFGYAGGGSFAPGIPNDTQHVVIGKQFLVILAGEKAVRFAKCGNAGGQKVWLRFATMEAAQLVPAAPAMRGIGCDDRSRSQNWGGIYGKLLPFFQAVPRHPLSRCLRQAMVASRGRVVHRCNV